MKTIVELKNATSSHDRINCGCELCEQYDKAEFDFTNALELTTENPASSYGIPVLVDSEGNAYGTNDMTPIGEAMPLYHLVASRTGWELKWEDCGNTLVGGCKP